jgi:predicted hydrocarbon binding protein
MLEIKNSPDPDPVAAKKMVDAYVRWALMATEEVAGKPGMGVVLREAGLGRFVDNYPPDELTVTGSTTFGDYANLNAGLLNFFGRASKSMLLRIGRISARHGIDRQSAMFGLAALVASKVLPLPAQMKLGMEAMQDGFRKVYGTGGVDMRLRVEDRGQALAYIAEDCPMCAGKLAKTPICFIHTGAITEGFRWQTGREVEVREIECRAMGAPACVWEASKTPKE